MSERRWATRAAIWCLGGWLLVSAAMAYVAGANFVLLRPENLRNADEVFSEIPAGEPRMRKLRYVASELNRTLFATYSRFQEIVGGLALVLLWASRRRRWAVLVLAVFCLATTVWFDVATAKITELGRGIDFDRDPAAVAAFDRFHQRAVRIEGAKMLAILAMSALLVRERPRETP